MLLLLLLFVLLLLLLLLAAVFIHIDHILHEKEEVLSQNNFLSGIDTFVGKLLAGIGFSKMYVITGGNNYPPIEEDVTFWCALP